MQNNYSTAKAAAIPAVPEFLDIVHYENQYGRTADTKEFALGIDYSDIEPVKINWKLQIDFAISVDDKNKVFITT